MSGSSARRGASPTSLGAGSAGDGVGGRSLPGSAQGTPVHVPMPPSTDGTPSTAYLERAGLRRAHAGVHGERGEGGPAVQHARGVARDGVVRLRAGQGAHGGAHRGGAEARRRSASVRGEPERPRRSHREAGERAAEDGTRGRRRGRCERRARLVRREVRREVRRRTRHRRPERILRGSSRTHLAAHRRPTRRDARARVDGRDDTAGEAGATGEAGPSGLSGLARPLRSFTYGDGDATDASLARSRSVRRSVSFGRAARSGPSPGGAEPDRRTALRSPRRPAVRSPRTSGPRTPGTADPNSAEPTAFGRDVRSLTGSRLFAKYLPEDDVGAAARRRVGAAARRRAGSESWSASEPKTLR